MKGFVFLLVYSFISVTIPIQIAHSRTYPAEPPRVKQSSLNALYLPSFGILSQNEIPFYDNFFVEGQYINLFAKGPNLNFYYGYSHQLRESVSFSNSILINLPQFVDRVYAKMNYSFLNFYQIDVNFEFSQNKNAGANSYFNDYNFNQISMAFNLNYDSRYSSLEKYYKGKVFLYPEEGLKTSIGLKYNLRNNNYSPLWYPFWIANTYFQYLLPLNRFWLINIEFTAESHLAHNTNKSELLFTRVVGNYNLPGDLMTDNIIELRYQTPRGIFWESPPFWYINSFLFKFSPGVIFGVNSGISANFDQFQPDFLNSIYISPLITIRMNGDLIAVTRFDFCYSTTKHYNFLLSINFSRLIGEKSILIFRQNF